MPPGEADDARKLEDLLRRYLASKERRAQEPAAPARRFRVALSFPGEARARVAAIADHLAGHFGRERVLYDQFHEAEFARPNLDVYLQTLYHDQAELNVVFLCKDYETKEWCGLEWRAIRDLIKHRRPEIMFLRIDDAPVSGVFSIDGYIDISNRNNDDVAQAILQRLTQDTPPLAPELLANYQDSASASASRRTLTTSPRACILDPDEQLQAYIPVVECAWGSKEATLILQPDDPTDGPFLDGLRGSRHQLHVAVKHNIGLCRVEDVQHILKAGIDQWTIRLRIEKSDFTPTMEMGMQGLSADDIAEQRARRILLNEHPYTEPKGNGADLLNDSLKEILLRGMNTPLQANGSPFLGLYEHYKNQPTKFLETAWITAVLILKATGAVAEVTSLTLALDGNKLQVAFNGKRRKQYTNQPATTINIKGACSLTRTKET